MWSRIRNRCRSSLQQHGNFTVAEDVQISYSALSNFEVPILSQTICLYATVDGAELSRPALRSERCTSKSTGCELKKARHSKRQLLIAAELTRLHKTNEAFDFDTGMRVILTYRCVRQMQTFRTRPMYLGCTILHFN